MLNRHCNFIANALYQVDSQSIAVRGGLDTSVTSLYNFYFGTASLSGGFTQGNGTNDFGKAASATTFPNLDLYPSSNSVFLNVYNDSTFWPLDDFNKSVRPFGTHADVGSYEVSFSNNQGWQVSTDFKP